MGTSEEKLNFRFVLILALFICLFICCLNFEQMFRVLFCDYPRTFISAWLNVSQCSCFHLWFLRVDTHLISSPWVLLSIQEKCKKASIFLVRTPFADICEGAALCICYRVASGIFLRHEKLRSWSLLLKAKTDLHFRRNKLIFHFLVHLYLPWQLLVCQKQHQQEEE